MTRSARILLGDILIHEYFRVDLALAWDMVQGDIPELISEVERILEEADE